MTPYQVYAHFCNISECILKWFNTEKVVSCCVTAQCGCPKLVDSSPLYSNTGIWALYSYGSATPGPWNSFYPSRRGNHQEDCARETDQAWRGPINCPAHSIGQSAVMWPYLPAKASGRYSPTLPRKGREWFLVTVSARSACLGTRNITVNMAQPLPSWPHAPIEERNVNRFL